MKKLLVVLLVLSVSLAVLAGCNLFANDSEVIEQKEEDVYAFSAASTGAILASLMTDLNATAAAEEETDAVEEQIDTVNECITMVECMLSDTNISMTEAVSDREEYAYMMVITNGDLNGNTYVYTLYYNEEAVNDDVTDEETEEVVKVESRLTGILVIDGVEYEVVGQKEIEGENFEIKFTAKIDETSYVKIKQEIENGEVKYVYTVFENGVKTNNFEIKFGNEGEERTVQMRVMNGDSEIRYKLMKGEESNKKFIRITTTEGDVTTSIKVHIEENEDGTEQYRYQYSNQNGQREMTRAKAKFCVGNTEE